MARRKAKSRGIGPKTIKVKPHTRTPRGKNAGKRAVHVRGYTRSRPRK